MKINYFNLALYTCIFALVYQLVFQLVPWNVLVVIGAVLLTFVSSYGLMWLFRAQIPRRTIHCHDKAVLITGCDSGFGPALALKLDALGFKVYAGCLYADGPGVQDLRSKSSDRLHVVQLDITQQDQVDAAYQHVNDTLDVCKLWAVVNNAGIAHLTWTEWCPVEKVARMIDVNAIGPYRVTRTFLPLLRESRGRIVIVASAAGRIVMPIFTAYSMSKFAAVALADGLRRELRIWPVSVHTIEPSFYKTPLLGEQNYSGLIESWNQSSPAVRTAYGEEYFNACLESGRKIVDSYAQPAEKIYEVVDDMVDAVAGVKPKIQYVPNIWTRLHLTILQFIPTRWLDWEIERQMFKNIPAANRATSEKY